jgi:hypothetical protein
MVGKPVPSTSGSSRQLAFPETLRHIANPKLQAVLTCYDLSDRRYNNTRARDWASFADRMNYITNLFRSRQRDLALFRSPWTPDQEASLLAGMLPGGREDEKSPVLRERHESAVRVGHSIIRGMKRVDSTDAGPNGCGSAAPATEGVRGARMFGAKWSGDAQ